MSWGLLSLSTLIGKSFILITLEAPIRGGALQTPTQDRFLAKTTKRKENKTHSAVVCNAPYRSPSVPLLKSLHWLPIEQRIEYKIATMTYKLRLHHQPSYLFELINDYKPVRCLRSSSSALMKLPPLNKSRTQTAARAFSLASPKIWNSLPVAVRESTSLSTFRRLLKGHLFNVFE